MKINKERERERERGRERERKRERGRYIENTTQSQTPTNTDTANRHRWHGGTVPASEPSTPANTTSAHASWPMPPIATFCATEKVYDDEDKADEDEAEERCCC
jgi:hypothetical protein